MARQVQIKEVTKPELKQDCGCGCGGALCGAARQQVIWVGSRKSEVAQETKTGQCNCGCGCPCCS